MDLIIFVIPQVLKLVITLSLLAVTWILWRKGVALGALASTVFSMGVAFVFWKPNPDEVSHIMIAIEAQMLWFSGFGLAFSPLALLLHKVEGTE